jgi:phosphoribosylaminoimidazole-succinocarboxamide synthase
VKPLAVPGPPPGPCEAKAALADNAVTTAEAKASCDTSCLVRDDAMTISCDAKFQKIRTTAYSGFENCQRVFRKSGYRFCDQNTRK